MFIPVLVAALATAATPAPDPGHPHDSGHAHHEGGLMTQVGDWMLMAHGFVNAIHDHQGGHRGDTKNFSNSMFMGVAAGPWREGSLELRTMLSLDPAMGKGGYPLLFQAGESANGTTHLIERQHPHDFFMELGARYRREFAGGAWFAYAALPGEPELGPPAFMHRASGIRIPEAPLAHHWLDSTHISMGVLSVGVERGDWTLGFSRFNGHEPDQLRWNLETHGLDSTAARLSWRPAPGWSLQVSHGDIRNPEQTVPEVYVRRDTFSIIHEGQLLGRPWATTFAYGRNDKRRQHFHYHLPAWLLESTAEPFERHTVFMRAEHITHDEASIPLRFRKVSLGYIYDFARTGPVTWGAGALVSNLRSPALVRFLYGERPVAYMMFLQARL